MIVYSIVAAALLCAFLKYLNVAAMSGGRLMQAVHFLPVSGYLLISFALLFAPGILLLSLLLFLCFQAVDKLVTVSSDYHTAKHTIPPTTKEWLHRLRFAPYIFAGLLIIYLATGWLRGSVDVDVHNHTSTPVKTVPTERIKPLPASPKPVSEWDSLKTLNP